MSKKSLGLKEDAQYVEMHTGKVQSGSDWQDDRDSMTDEEWGDGELCEAEEVDGEWVPICGRKGYPQ